MNNISSTVQWTPPTRAEFSGQVEVIKSKSIIQCHACAFCQVHSWLTAQTSPHKSPINFYFCSIYFARPFFDPFVAICYTHDMQCPVQFFAAFTVFYLESVSAVCGMFMHSHDSYAEKTRFCLLNLTKCRRVDLKPWKGKAKGSLAF